MLHWSSEKALAIIDYIQSLFVAGEVLKFDFFIFLIAFLLIAFMLGSDWVRNLLLGIGRYITKTLGR